MQEPQCHIYEDTYINNNNNVSVETIQRMLNECTNQIISGISEKILKLNKQAQDNAEKIKIIMKHLHLEV